MKIDWNNKKPYTRFYLVDNSSYQVDLSEVTNCFRCNHLVKKLENNWMGKCNQCNSLICFFKPTPIQEVAINCKANILFNIGAVGSGKTTISSYLLSTQLRAIGNSRLICAAQTLDQLTKNAISELEKFFYPDEFKKKTKDSWELVNGAVIEFWPSDAEDKLRSANANFIWLIEANSFKMQQFFNQATSRIRNQLGLVYDRDKNNQIKTIKNKNGIITPKVLENRNMIIVEGNPKRGAWFNTTILNAHTIIYTKNVKGIDKIKYRAQPLTTVNEYTKQTENVDMVGILNASYDNPLLDEKYFINMRIGCSSQEEYDQKVFCDITSESGLVFKQVVEKPNDYFIDIQSYNQMNPNLVFVECLDPGGSKSNNDPDAYLFGVFDKQRKQLTILDGFKEAGLNLAQAAQRIWEIRRKWFFSKEKSLLFVADNALGKATKYSSSHSFKSEYEIRLGTPIRVCNNKAIGAGVGLVNNWLNNKAISIDKQRCSFLVKEFYGYETFLVPKTTKGSDAVNWVSAYTETNNHALDALRYLIVELEGYGYRQDQAFIDYNNAIDKVSDDEFGLTITHKGDIRQFLPQFQTGSTPLKQFNKLKIKF